MSGSSDRAQDTEAIRAALKWHGVERDKRASALRALRRLVARLEAAELLADAILEQRCNGCRLPRREWGPICSGMTQGDFMHFHSPAWWAQRTRAAALAAAAPGETTEPQ